MKFLTMKTLSIAAATLMAFTGCKGVGDRLTDGLYPVREVEISAYYIDSREGDDSNDGLTSQTAWKTLGKVEDVVMEAGQSILLKKGSVWTGQLAPKGSGSAASPAVIGTYGEGDMPQINGAGVVDAAIKLTNQSNWVIEGIEATNTAPQRDVYRCGIMVVNDGGGTVSNITVRGNRIHDVTGLFKYNGNNHPHQFGGISFTTTSTTAGDEKFDDILIEDNHVERVGRTGIVVWDFVWNTDTYASTNVVIRGNTVREIDSDGILTYGCNGSLIEGNLADGCGSYREDGEFNGSAGIWCTRGRNCVIQRNEARNTKALEGNTDGTGFDIDLQSTDCIVQYNYSHDNAGGFMLLVDARNQSPGPSNGSIVRYNISRNDGERIFLIAGGVTPGLQIYNNTIYIGTGLTTKIIDHSWDEAGDVNAAWSFRNNIIYNLGSGDYVIPGNGGEFAGNAYFGNHPAGEPAETDKLTVDPGLTNAGSGGDGIATLDGYKLLETSPLINAGVLVSSNGGLDFWGNPVSAEGRASVGAHEPNGDGDPVVPPDPPDPPDPPEEGIVDPLANTNLMVWFDNIMVAWSSDEDIDNFFEGDATKICSQSGTVGAIAYHLDAFTGFTITAYFYGDPGDNPFLNVYGAPVLDLAQAQPIACNYTLGATHGDWRKYIVTPQGTVSGYNYFAIQMPTIAGMENWAVQLDEVRITK